MEGDLSTHFCVKRIFPAFLFAAFSCSFLYLIYACAIPSVADPLPRRRKVAPKEKVGPVEPVVVKKEVKNEGKKATKRKKENTK